MSLKASYMPRRKKMKIYRFLKVRATDAHPEFHEIEPYAASDEWLQKFKERFGIRCLKIIGEMLSINFDIIDHRFKQKLTQMITKTGVSENHVICKSGEMRSILEGATR